MTTIPFTHHLRPDGHQLPIKAPCPLGWEGRVEKFLAEGVRFTCEVLTTGEVVLYAGLDDDDFAIEISPNDVRLNDALLRLLEACERKIQP